jgi:wyosine [tRNA(Phe)-imidazoG37] synthetase (radical SAM superfamily)
MKIDGTLAFGPVPSRRLGRSLGINNIPPKRCTYSCVYCQLGHTVRLQVDREPFYRPERILDQVRDRVESVREKGERVDYITFVPQGEPTLEVNLGREIEALKPLGIKVAVISNGSLVWKEDVREALQNADWVSLKVDTVGEETWRRVNRPHGRLELKAILEGMLSFARDYDGALATETMLVQASTTERAPPGSWPSSWAAWALIRPTCRSPRALPRSCGYMPRRRRRSIERTRSSVRR